MSKWSVGVTITEVEKNPYGVWADADVRIGEMLIYGFQVHDNEEGQIVVHGPQREFHIGSYKDVFAYLDDELEEQVSEAVIKAYIKKCMWDNKLKKV